MRLPTRDLNSSPLKLLNPIKPFKHTLSIAKDGTHYLMRDRSNMVCMHDRRPYEITLPNGKKRTVHTHCTSTCPMFHKSMEDEPTVVVLACGMREMEIPIYEVVEKK